MQSDVDDGPGRHPHAGMALAELFQWGQEAGLLHQAGGVAGPALGHRAAAVEGDARGAVDRRDPSNARLRSVGMPVLDVMADAPVVNDVVELDDAVVGRLENAFLYAWWHLRLHRFDQVVDGRHSIEGCRRPVEEEIEVVSSRAHPIWTRNVADRIVGP